MLGIFSIGRRILSSIFFAACGQGGLMALAEHEIYPADWIAASINYVIGAQWADADWIWWVLVGTVGVTATILLEIALQHLSPSARSPSAEENTWHISAWVGPLTGSPQDQFICFDCRFTNVSETEPALIDIEIGLVTTLVPSGQMTFRTLYDFEPITRKRTVAPLKTKRHKRLTFPLRLEPRDMAEGTLEFSLSQDISDAWEEHIRGGDARVWSGGTIIVIDRLTETHRSFQFGKRFDARLGRAVDREVA